MDLKIPKQLTTTGTPGTDMIEPITISKAKPEEGALDYHHLREVGMQYLQQTAGNIWTDYNAHDPGVTILEQLAYAITELSFKINFDMKDILETAPEEKDIRNFYTAREALTNNPVTIDDYRKLAMDVIGVKNAWLEPTTKSEQKFYADRKHNQLTYVPLSSTSTEVKLNGLYRILLEFGDHEEYGDLNTNRVETELEIQTGELEGLEIKLSVEMPLWEDLSIDWKDLDSIKSGILRIDHSIREIDKYDVQILVDEDAIFEIQVISIYELGQPRKPGLETALKTRLNKLFATSGDLKQSLVSQYQEKVLYIQDLVKNVKSKLMSHRNLCEDFAEYNTLRVEDIIICADIEVTADADLEEVLAEVYHLIEDFLSPTVYFYSLEEMIAKGKRAEEIFEGPALDHGFVDNEELVIASRRKWIHVSDLIQIIMDIPGVIAVRDIQIANLPQGEDPSIVTKSVHWCLELAYEKNYVPRLSISGSKIRFTKGGIPYFANEDEMLEVLDELRDSDRPQKGESPVLDWEIPTGEYRNLGAYTPVQHGFPMTYGIGEAGLPDSVGNFRHAQAKQLKGYLLFFEQLLANFMSQIDGVRHLFSMNSSIESTYFSQPVYDLADAGYMYKQFLDKEDIKTPLEGQDYLDFLSKWESFKADPSNELVEGIKGITESKELFEDRRNRFLDHLMARFAEDFNEYALLMYRIDRKKAKSELIEDKLALLNDYPAISGGRGKAFNYKEVNEMWNTSNVAGLVKRVARLVGIDDYKRRHLSYDPAENIEFEQMPSGKWRFFMRIPKGTTWGIRSKQYATKEEAESEMQQLLEAAPHKENYELKKSASGKYYFRIEGLDKISIVWSRYHSTPEARQKVIDYMLDYFTGMGNEEGMHIVEHILLRPRHNTPAVKDPFLPVHLEEECYCAGNEDPYSFRVSVIMPYWPDRFRNQDFRRFFERTLRLEAPAHVLFKICWVDQEQMRKFEQAWRKWLNANVKEKITPSTWSKALKDLITVMGELRNVYPNAILHDCEDNDEGNAPVFLDHTVLGTF